MIMAHQGVFIASPEYSASVTPLLKNALDWVSRTSGRPLRDKPVAIISAADGRGGGDRSQYALRLMLVAFRPHVLQGPELLVPDGRAGFDGEGRLILEPQRKGLEELMAGLRAAAVRR